MSRFTDRLERDLDQIADRASPSSTAWESILTRIDEQADQPDMEVIMLTPDENRLDGRRRTWLMVAAAIAAVALVGGLIIAVTRSGDDPEPADQPEPTAVPPFDVEGASAVEAGVLAEFFEAEGDGDTDGVLETLAADAVVGHGFGGAVFNPAQDSYDVGEFEAYHAWLHEQGTWITSPECELMSEDVFDTIQWPEQAPDGTHFECSYDTFDAIIRAVDGEPIPTRTLITVQNGAINQLHTEYGRPDFLTLGSNFYRWLDDQHPEFSEDAGCCPETREEAATMGATRSEWAQRWAQYLAENGCEATELCVPDAESDGESSTETDP